MSFNEHDTNTICDVTGFKVKFSETMERWDGVRCIPETWHPRHPQDIPPNILTPKTYPSRTEETDYTVTSFDII